MVNVWLLLLFVTCVLSSYFEKYELTNNITPKNIQKRAIFGVTGSKSNGKNVDGEITMVSTPKNGLYWDETKNRWCIYNAQGEISYEGKEDYKRQWLGWYEKVLYEGQKDWYDGQWKQVPDMKVMVKPTIEIKKLAEKEEDMETKTKNINLAEQEITKTIIQEEGGKEVDIDHDLAKQKIQTETSFIVGKYYEVVDPFGFISTDHYSRDIVVLPGDVLHLEYECTEFLWTIRMNDDHPIKIYKQDFGKMKEIN